MMRNLPFVLRLLPLAAAALASVATSAIPAGIRITGATPPNGETAVAATVRPEITMEVDPDTTAPALESLTLRRLSDGALVTGHAERGETDGAWVYRFVPDAALPADDYRLELAFADGVERDLSTDEVVPLDESVYSGPVAVTFSTVSRPTVRTSSLAAGSGSGYVLFSQEMDVASLAEHVQIHDATGDELPVTLTWIGGRQHQLEIASVPGAVELVLEPGVRGADGTEMPGLPLVLAAQ